MIKRCVAFYEDKIRRTSAQGTASPSHFPVQVERLQFQLRQNKFRTTSKADLDGTVDSGVAQAAFLKGLEDYLGSTPRLPAALGLWTSIDP